MIINFDGLNIFLFTAPLEKLTQNNSFQTRGYSCWKENCENQIKFIFEMISEDRVQSFGYSWWASCENHLQELQTLKESSGKFEKFRKALSVLGCRYDMNWKEVKDKNVNHKI